MKNELTRMRETLALLSAANQELSVCFAYGPNEDIQAAMDRRDALRAMYESQMWDIRVRQTS